MKLLKTIYELHIDDLLRFTIQIDFHRLALKQ